MNEKIRLSKSVVGAAETAMLARVIADGYLGMGGFVQEFEQKLTGFFPAAHVVCVNSGTAALHLALMGLRLQPGDEVLIQSLTFVASFQAITAAGLVPVACEIDPATNTIDLTDARSRLTDRTRVILPVHYAGRPGNLDAIYEFARSHNLRVVEDAAHAFGTTYQGKKIGSFGDVACFSFDGIKNITSGEGGAVVTADDRVAHYVRDARLLGVDKDTEKRYQGQRSWEFDVLHQGYRYHMSNLFAGIGLAQLERFATEFKPKRQHLARRYTTLLQDIRNLTLFPDDYDTVVPHIFPVRIGAGRRDRLRQTLSEKNIESGIHYFPNHRLTFFRRDAQPLPTTEKVYSELLSLPLHPEITESQQDLIVNIIREEMTRS